MTIYKVGSLFAGVGGICLGFKQASDPEKRFELTWANEFDKYVAQTYRKNFDHRMIEGNIKKIINPNLDIDPKKDEKTDIDYEEGRQYIIDNPVDILTAGFPCQTFSIAGNQQGFDDNRGNLFYSIIDLLNLYITEYGEDHLPRVLFLENVKNLVGHDDGRTFRIIRNELEELGYHISYKVLNTADYTEIPQNRERIYLVCFREEQDFNNFNLFENIDDYRINRTEEERINHIRNILDLDITIETHKKYYYTREKYPHYFITEEEYENIDEAERKDNRINLTEQITEQYQFYQLRRGMYVRQNQSGLCPTLTANMGTGGHHVPIIRVSDGIRKLTPKETFSLQGFPVNENYDIPDRYTHINRPYADGRLYKQAGNSVTIPIVNIISQHILEVL